MRRATAMVTGLALLALLLLLMHTGEDVEAQAQCRVEVASHQTHQVAEISPGGNTRINYTGTVTFTKPAWVLIDVTITLDVEMPDLVDVWENYFTDGEELVFDSSSTKGFNATVVVPDLPAHESHRVIFNASTSDIPDILFEVQTTIAYIDIAQYYRIGDWHPTEPSKVKQGKSTTFNFTIHNQGNGDDTFNIEVVNLVELDMRDIQVFYPSAKRLAPDEEVSVTVRIEAGDDAKEGEAQIDLKLTSEGSRTDSPQDPLEEFITVYVVVEKALINTLIKDYWYVLVAIAVVVVVLGVVVSRRRKRIDAELDAAAEKYMKASKVTEGEGEDVEVGEGPDEGNGELEEEDEELLEDEEEEEEEPE